MIGTTISHYRIVSQIGSGGMGTVYLAEDLSLHRKVALKFLPPETARSPDAATRLLREARAASALDHPHIATIYEIGEAGGQPFIAMVYYEGETLAARLARGPLAVVEVARILSQIAGALDAASAGIVHRDVKPAAYMAPEQATGEIATRAPISGRSAWWPTRCWRGGRHSLAATRWRSFTRCSRPRLRRSASPARTSRRS